MILWHLLLFHLIGAGRIRSDRGTIGTIRLHDDFG